MSTIRLALQFSMAAAILLAAACQTTTQKKPSSPFVSGTGPLPAPPPPAGRSIGMDPCMDQMQEICGALLYFYRLRGRLPNTVAELSAVSQFTGPLALTCTASKKPYLLDPDGFAVPNNPGHGFIYDPEPSHAGMRFVIIVEEKDAALIARPVAVAESDLPARIRSQKSSQ